MAKRKQTIAQTVRRALKEKMRTEGAGLFQVSKQCGVHYGQLGNFLKGEDRADIRLSTLERICDYLGASVKIE